MKTESHSEPILKVHRENATWLGVVDIMDHAPVTLTIDAVVRYRGGVFDKGREQDGQAIRFKETKKLLPLNATNTSKLAEFGKVPADFAGKRITLGVVRLQREFNGSTHGIRIQEVSP